MSLSFRSWSSRWRMYSAMNCAWTLPSWQGDTAGFSPDGRTARSSLGSRRVFTAMLAFASARICGTDR